MERAQDLGSAVGIEDTRRALRMAQRELKLVRTEQEHQLETLQRVRRQRARLRVQVTTVSDTLAAVLSEAYWAERHGTRRWSGRGARDPEATLVAEVEASDLFDGGWYLRQYLDVAEQRIAPAVHLVRFGNERLLDPSEAFSTSRHLTAHPDTGGLPALVHHLRSGAER
ncbi:hypothetical protein [Nocardioides sp. P5_C9_2]